MEINIAELVYPLKDVLPITYGTKLRGFLPIDTEIDFSISINLKVIQV